MAAPKGNLYALGNNGGRPPVFDSPQALEAKVIEYFDYIEETEDIATITGLALYLGFCSHNSLLDYEEKGKEYFCIVKRAKEIIMNRHEKRLNSATPAGSIFWLKNFGWKDTQQIDHTNNGNSFNNLSDAELVARLSKLIDPGTKG